MAAKKTDFKDTKLGAGLQIASLALGYLGQATKDDNILTPNLDDVLHNYTIKADDLDRQAKEVLDEGAQKTAQILQQGKLLSAQQESQFAAGNITSSTGVGKTISKQSLELSNIYGDITERSYRSKASGLRESSEGVREAGRIHVDNILREAEAARRAARRKKRGGLFGLVGAGLGAILGGAPGAALGGKIGESLGS